MAESTDLEEGRAVSVSDLVQAQERRERREREQLDRLAAPIIEVGLDLPGPKKRLPFSDATMREAVKLVRAQLEARRVPVLHERQHSDAGGVKTLLSVRARPAELKRWMVQIEDAKPLGRLFDIGVLADSVRVERASLGASQRRCLLCDRPAQVCARNRAHPTDRLVATAERLMRDHFGAAFCAQVAREASRALLYELTVTPKPGLVDRWGSGSHSDMDFYLMLDSVTALTPHFQGFANAGVVSPHADPTKLLPELRYLGIRAEDDMRQATRGVNTHKGAIFALGLACVAAGRLFATDRMVTADALLDGAGDLATGVLEDFEQIGRSQSRTHGETLFATHGVLGARGEAVAGFPRVRGVGLPRLRECLARGDDLNDAGLSALLQLVTVTEDTNMMSRSDPRTAARVRHEVARELARDANERDVRALAAALSESFAKQQLSPGGAGDLLAMTFFVHFLEEHELPGRDSLERHR